MVKTLLSNDISVAVWNRSVIEDSPVPSFQNMTEMMSFVRQANPDQDNHLFFSCVSDDSPVNDIFNKYGFLAAMKPTDHIIEMSTISPEAVLAASEQVRNHLQCNNFLAAPVSGSKPQANSGTLVILAS